MRWIVFDAETADAVVTRLRRGAAEIQHENPVDAALRSEGATILVMPSRDPDKLVMARFEQREVETTSPETHTPQLTPNPVSAIQAAPAAKTSWWKRLIA